MTYSIQNEIISFTAEELSVKYSSLNIDTSLNYDLGLDGDEAIEFFEKLAKKFHLNLDIFFQKDFDKYFSYEGINPMKSFFMLFTSPKKLQIFTIQMLIEVCTKSVEKTK